MASKLTAMLLADMERYLKGEMTGLELQKFEQKLKEDAELRSELRIQIELFEAVGNNSDYSVFQEKLNREEVDKLKSKLRSKEYQDLSANIKNAEKVYFSEQSKVRPFQKYYRYLAIAGVIVLFFGIYFSQMNPSYSSYYDSYVDYSTLPSFIEKGEVTTFTKGELVFKKEDYQAAAEYFAAIETSNELYPHSLLWLGASYDKLNQNDKAITTFQKLSKVADPYLSSKGYWYEALIHLKDNDKEKAMKALEKSTEDEDNFNFQEAKVLLRKLD
ncbi:tetratricopeptide repeat protein [Kordia sp. YSTF-M3]|uniref:Tetratricopeptide repeat protein n=1 Tax=Kordia aestuariivivens TaxID=2759037 RepID=A0ABR7Q801_9FLAO|nr:tetratricopeptide repeat protein [Kordia aestuariivivens]MBC8754618.1 tetratricopeptide repeat protein [Kordia aestuariivivens]